MKKAEVVKTETEATICQSTDISLGLKLDDGVLTCTGKFEYDSAMEVFINENKHSIEKVDFSQAIELFVLPDSMFSKCKNLREILLPEGVNPYDK